MLDVYKLMELKRPILLPIPDRLVKEFNRMLIDMLVKCAENNGKDWDQQLPYVLFAYILQHSTRESPFYLLSSNQDHSTFTKAYAITVLYSLY